MKLTLQNHTSLRKGTAQQHQLHFGKVEPARGSSRPKPNNQKLRTLAGDGSSRREVLVQDVLRLQSFAATLNETISELLGC